MNRNLDEITLVIITYNRYSFLLRLLRFYQSYGFPTKILILDSSSDSLADVELSKLLEHPQITHQKFQADIFITHKISGGLKNVSTPFSVLCADDDYIIPTALSPCVDFLKKHEDYVAAQGFYINHFLRKDSQGQPSFFWSPLYIAQRSVNMSCPLERFRFSLENFAGSIFYAVYRTQHLRLIWEETVLHVWDWGLSETLPMALSFLYGKLKILPILYSSREANNYAWYTLEHLRQIYSVQKCESAIKCMAEQISCQKGIDRDSAYLVARESLQVNLKRNFEKYLKKQRQDKTPRRFLLENPVIRLGSKAYRFLKWLGIKAGYWLILAPQCAADFRRVKISVLSANIGSEVINRIREEYSRK